MGQGHTVYSVGQTTFFHIYKANDWQPLRAGGGSATGGDGHPPQPQSQPGKHQLNLSFAGGGGGGRKSPYHKTRF